MTEALPSFVAAPTSLRLNSGGETVVTVTNRESRPITFKVKTTTPSRYVVRPRVGYIQGNQAVLVSIQHRPGAESGNAPANLSLLRDRFKVECVFLPPSALIGADGSAVSTSSTPGEHHPAVDDAVAKLWAAKPRSKEIELQCEVSLMAQPGGGSAGSSVLATPASGVAASPSSATPTTAAPAAATPGSALTAATTTTTDFIRSELESRVQRLKDNEEGMKQTIARLETELKQERTKLEDALVAARAKDREVQLLGSKVHAAGYVVPLRLVIPMILLSMILTYLYAR